MATSGSTDFTLTSAQIIEKAFQILGVGQEGEALTARMSADGMLSLNLLLKTWGAKPYLWIKSEQSITLTQGTTNYTTSPRAMRVLSVRRKTTSSGIGVPLNELSRSDYYNQPNKTVESVPTAFYFDPQLSTGKLYVWPTASSATASAQTLSVTYLRRIEDIDASNNEADLPQEWLQTLIWNLANELEPEYPVTDSRLAIKIEAKAARLLADLSVWDNEPASVDLQPDYGHV